MSGVQDEGKLAIGNPVGAAGFSKRQVRTIDLRRKRLSGRRTASSGNLPSAQQLAMRKRHFVGKRQREGMPDVPGGTAAILMQVLHILRRGNVIRATAS